VNTQAIALSVQRNRVIYGFWLACLATALVLVQTLSVLAKGAPDSFADLAEGFSPSVVNITTSTVVAGRTGPQGIVPEGSPFEDFFREFQSPDGPGGEKGRRPRRSSALGSGFVISEDGYVVTNNHVIEGADEIMIEFFEGGELPAKVVGTDPKTDIALLKVIADAPLKFVSFGDSDVSRVGDWVMAMGNPLGQGFSVSVGIVSARNRALSGSYDDYLQTDAAINRGNSGGPLFNMAGDVIGVNTAILSPNGGSIGIGFSMASNVVVRVVDQLKEFGETRRGWLGVRIQNVSEDMIEAIDGLDKAEGALVSDVPDGPALDAGMQAGDIILSFDGNKVEDTRGLVRQVGNADVGKAVRVVVLRDGASKTLKIVLGRREDAEAATPVVQKVPQEPQQKKILGLSLSTLTDELRSQLELDTKAAGLVVQSVEDTSQAYEKGLRAGDLITEAGQQPINQISDFEARVEAAKTAGRKSLLLLVRRAGDPRFVALGLTEK
jgi:serine protease Do